MKRLENWLVGKGYNQVEENVYARRVEGVVVTVALLEDTVEVTHEHWARTIHSSYPYPLFWFRRLVRIPREIRRELKNGRVVCMQNRLVSLGFKGEVQVGGNIEYVSKGVKVTMKVFPTIDSWILTMEPTLFKPVYGVIRDDSRITEIEQFMTELERLVKK